MSELNNVYLIENNSLSKPRMNIMFEAELCNVYYDADQSSFEEVASTVPNKDDQSMPCLTFRSFFVGFVYVMGMSYVHQWTYTAVYRFYIGPFVVIVTSHLVGRLPLIFGLRSFSIKEDTVVLLMANAASCFNYQYQYASLGLLLEIEGNQFNYVHTMFLVVALQFLGFGYAGALRRYLVWPSGQIWPSNMPYIALLRTLHEDQSLVQKKIYGTEKRSIWWVFLDNRKGFFCVFSLLQFVYCWFPKYIMRVLASFSWMCMIAPNNLLLSQLTGFRGLGIGSLTFDWQSLSAFLGSPLVVPKLALINIAIGFVVITWILTPILYFSNVWNCKEQSIGSYSVGGILNTGNNSWSALGIATAATGFATPIAVIVHMFLHHGKEFLNLLRTRSIRFKGNDLHCRLISSYPDVPDWWYGIISVLALIVLIVVGEKSNILEWYYVLLALLIPLIFCLPMGSIFSITGQIIQNASVYYVCLVIAYAIFGDENIARNRSLFITIGYTTFCQTLYLTSDMKLSHYMKIAPRILFLVQSFSCLVCSVFSVVIKKYYEETSVGNSTVRIGQYAILADFSEVSAFVSSTFFDSNSRYQVFVWIMIVGSFLPILFWIGGYRWSWCRRVNIPLILIVVSWMPSLPPGSLLTWIILGLISVLGFDKIYRKRHVYLFSAALSFGLNVMLIIAGAALWNRHVAFPIWWGTGGRNQDGCPLALNQTVGDWFFLSLHNTPD